MITRAHMMPYLGQHIVVRTRDGNTHHGILHSVTDDGIYLRGMRGRPMVVNGLNGAGSETQLLHNLQQSESDIEQTFWPFFFLPWLAIGAFWPWGWWW